MKKARAVGIQYAALPWRQPGRRLEVLLITSRETRRWVIPKGWPMKGLAPHEAAAVEAFEEAGLVGEIETSPLGSYRYLKRLEDGQTLPVQVIVFPMQVDSQADDWKEQGQRQLSWFTPARAAARVAEPSLKRLIREFNHSRGQTALTVASRLGRLLESALFDLRR